MSSLHDAPEVTASLFSLDDVVLSHTLDRVSQPYSFRKLTKQELKMVVRVSPVPSYRDGARPNEHPVDASTQTTEILQFKHGPTGWDNIRLLLRDADSSSSSRAPCFKDKKTQTLKRAFHAIDD